MPPPPSVLFPSTSVVRPSVLLTASPPTCAFSPRPSRRTHSAHSVAPSPWPPPQNDVWALGVMALEAITGTHPFSPDHYHYENVLYSIAHCSKVNLPSNLSPEFTDWLEQALHRDPAQRASTAELLAHPWVAKEYTEEELAQLAARQGGRAGPALHGAADPYASFDCWEY